jgi:hypothetical protein
MGAKHASSHCLLCHWAPSATPAPRRHFTPPICFLRRCLGPNPSIADATVGTRNLSTGRSSFARDTLCTKMPHGNCTSPTRNYINPTLGMTQAVVAMNCGQHIACFISGWTGAFRWCGYGMVDLRGRVASNDCESVFRVSELQPGHRLCASEPLFCHRWFVPSTRTPTSAEILPSVLLPETPSPGSGCGRQSTTHREGKPSTVGSEADFFRLFLSFG